MGRGEQIMRTYGYVGGGFAIGMGLLGFIMAIVGLILTTSTVADDTKSSMLGVFVLGLVAAIASIVVASVAVWKISLANQVYLEVASRAARGTIPVVLNTKPEAPPLQSKPISVVTAPLQTQPQTDVPEEFV